MRRMIRQGWIGLAFLGAFCVLGWGSSAISQPGLAPKEVPLLDLDKPIWRAASPSRPRVAIVIDDLGDNWERVETVLKIDAPLTLSFLPQTEFQHRGMEQAFLYGKEILLHAPMEPDDPAEMTGLQYLTTGMSEAEMVTYLERQLYRCPNCVGLNNHMGSRFTRDPEAMSRVLRFVRSRNLLFLDSRTTEATVAYPLAKKMGIAALMRDVFLDHDPRTRAIERQFRVLRRTALSKGRAIAIGHPHRSTLALLQQEITRLQRDGIELVGLSELR